MQGLVEQYLQYIPFVIDNRVPFNSVERALVLVIATEDKHALLLREVATGGPISPLTHRPNLSPAVFINGVSLTL